MIIFVICCCVTLHRYLWMFDQLMIKNHHLFEFETGYVYTVCMCVCERESIVNTPPPPPTCDVW